MVVIVLRGTYFLGFFLSFFLSFSRFFYKISGMKGKHSIAMKSLWMFAKELTSTI